MTYYITCTSSAPSFIIIIIFNFGQNDANLLNHYYSFNFINHVHQTRKFII